MIDIVIPTLARPSLRVLLESLAQSVGPLPQRIIIVDDRAPDAPEQRNLAVPTRLVERTTIVRGDGRGPAAARNRGWRAAGAEWIAFLDDDVIVEPTWLRDLIADIARCPQTAAGIQGRVAVPLPVDRRPTDWERNVAGLATARYITADCAYRRQALIAVGGFDERFPRAFREDADLALRVMTRGWRIVWGERGVLHPVRPASPLISIALQAGNADDVLMTALHGPDWFERADAARGTFDRHLVTVAFGVTSFIAGLAWAAATLDFAWRRIAPGPRTAREIGAMLVTSCVIPFAAVTHRIAGYLALPRALAVGRRRSGAER
jgi:glycosyltransferase involved in cell wall biosynthesis